MTLEDFDIDYKNKNILFVYDTDCKFYFDTFQKFKENEIQSLSVIDKREESKDFYLTLMTKDETSRIKYNISYFADSLKELIKLKLVTFKNQDDVNIYDLIILNGIQNKNDIQIFLQNCKTLKIPVILNEELIEQ